jgi:hypothetical protein
MEQKESLMHEIIKANPKACSENEIPEGFGEFGLDKTNPIPIYGMDNIDNYMSQLRYETISKDGSSIFLPVQYQRTIENENSELGSEMPKNEGLVGSTFASNIGNNIDVYNVYTFEGTKKLAKLFIHCYHWKTSTKVPNGFFKEIDSQEIENSLKKNNIKNVINEKITETSIKIDGEAGWIILGFILSFLGGWGGLLFGFNYIKSKYNSNTRIIGGIMIFVSIIMRAVLSSR